MNHLTEELINEYLDHALTNAQTKTVKNHLLGCSACEKRVTQVQELFSKLEMLPEAQLSRDLSGSVMQTLQNSSALPKPIQWTLAFQSALILLTAIFIIPSFLPEGFLFPTSLPITLSLELFYTLPLEPLNWFNLFAIPQLPSLPAFDETTVLTTAYLGIFTFLLWIVGSGLLLKSHKS